jgi:hypothetical protein
MAKRVYYLNKDPWFEAGGCDTYGKECSREKNHGQDGDRFHCGGIPPAF